MSEIVATEAFQFDGEFFKTRAEAFAYRARIKAIPALNNLLQKTWNTGDQHGNQMSFQNIHAADILNHIDEVEAILRHYRMDLTQ